MPDTVTTNWWKEERGERIFVDFNQNNRDRTIASAYSLRPIPGAPVSTPLRWEELGVTARPRDFGMRQALERVERHGDLFAPTLGGGQSLGAALRELRALEPASASASRGSRRR